MISWFTSLAPTLQALLAGGFTWGVTALGAATVFLRREPPPTLLDAMLGFAAGVMIAASFWSLLQPAIELAAAQGGGIGYPRGTGGLRRIGPAGQPQQREAVDHGAGEVDAGKSTYIAQKGAPHHASGKEGREHQPLHQPSGCPYRHAPQPQVPVP